MRAGYRQVIDVAATVVENAFRPYNGRSADYSLEQQWICSPLGPPCANCVQDFRHQSEPC